MGSICNFNLQFYTFKIKFEPNGCLLNEFLRNRSDDYDFLENNHSYIQWIFPIETDGQNPNAHKLNNYEINVLTCFVSIFIICKHKFFYIFIGF